MRITTSKGKSIKIQGEHDDNYLCYLTVLLLFFIFVLFFIHKMNIACSDKNKIKRDGNNKTLLWLK